MVQVGDHKTLENSCGPGTGPQQTGHGIELHCVDLDYNVEREDDNYTGEHVLADKPDPIVPGKRLYKVRWKGFLAPRNSWEPLSRKTASPRHQSGI